MEEGSVGRKILLVDDDESIIEVLSESLGGAGFEIVTASNGEEAVAQALVHTPDLVVSDIVMPKMDGWDLCQTLRSLPSTKAVPFIFLSSLDQAPEKLLALRLGADAYLTKPFNMQAILEKVRQLVGRIDGREGILEGEEQAVSGEKLENILVDTIEFLQATGRTGVVSVQKGPSKGLVYIDSGRLKHAVFDGRKGEEALFAMIRLPDSQVAFKENSYPELPSNFLLTWQQFMASLSDRG
jgi:CheY-like chemotaxis protein